jgi:serine/threonine protein kinase
VPSSTSAKPLFTRLGRYEVKASIGEGGMAAVYLGRSTDEDKPVVALKVIRPEYARDLAFVAMFLDEAKLTSRLNHPNIVKVYEQASDGGHLFIAMELLFGQSLASVWEAAERTKRKLPHEVVAWIGARVADALQHAHELKDDQGVPQEVVHRDINPSNIFITYGGHVKIIDFGLAKAVDRLTSTAFGVVKGKLAYMSPEQVGGQGVDRRADIFSLGTTLWEITCDRRLFKCERDVETMQKVQAAEVPDPKSIVPGYPPALAAILGRALAREREARYQSAGGLAKDLDAFAGEGGRIVTPATLLEIMTGLFAVERDRDAKWFEEIGLPIQTVPLAPVVLPSTDLKTAYELSPVDLEASKGGSSKGTPPDAPGEVSPVAPTMTADALSISVASAPSSKAIVRQASRPSSSSSMAEIPGLPKGAFGLLSSGELAMFGALGMLVVVAVAVAIWAMVR